jgi:hypothetical protein
MAPVLTLHQGDSEASFVEHPIEVARKALNAAADIESEQIAARLRRVAELLPVRTTITNGGE